MERKSSLGNKVASGVGSAFGLFLIFLGVFSVLGGGLIGGIWWALIGLFLRSASKMSYQNVLVRDALEGESVRRFMKEEPVTVAADTTVDHLVEDFIYKYHYKMFPVVKDSKPLSCVNINDVRNIPREEWNHHTVDELAKPCSTDNTISIDEDALKALSLMNRTGSSRLMVVDHGGRLVGMVAMRDLMRFLALKLDLEEESVSKDNRNE